MKLIDWNANAHRYLTPLQRDSYERGEQPRKLEGKLSTDASGNVWLTAGEVRKILGTTTAPAVETRASGELDAPGEAPAADAPKAKRARAKAKRKSK